MKRRECDREGEKDPGNNNNTNIEKDGRMKRTGSVAEIFHSKAIVPRFISFAVVQKVSPSHYVVY